MTVPSGLPDPIANAKVAKRHVKTVFGVLVSLDLFQCENKSLENVREDEKLEWLMVKFGWNVVSSVAEYIIPR